MVRLEAEANISSADDFTSPMTPAELCLHSLGELAPATAELPASQLLQVLMLVSASAGPQYTDLAQTVHKKPGDISAD